VKEEATVTVEFYGIPRQRAGRAELRVRAGTVAEVLARVQEQCPGLKLMNDEGRWPKEYLLSINGERFVTGLDEQLKPGERVLLLSADAGG
jgi:molybdopterin converting factor small subunit